LNLKISANAHKHQRGGIKGRQLADNIIDVEGHCIEAILTVKHMQLPVLVLYDFVQAFPSILRGFLYGALEAAGVPCFIIWAIQELYSDAFHSIVFNGCVFPGFRVESGINQGCSMSAALFALCVDTFIKSIYFFCKQDVHVRSLYDDTSMVLYNASRDGRDVLELFCLFRKASGLGLNSIKSVVLPLWPPSHNRHAVYKESILRIFKDFIFRLSAKYLGIFIGPDAWANPWQHLVARYNQAVYKLRGFGLGLLASLRIYNVRFFHNSATMGNFIIPTN
jgi:hypothetical protein